MKMVTHPDHIFMELFVHWSEFKLPFHSAYCLSTWSDITNDNILSILIYLIVSEKMAAILQMLFF